MDGYTLQGIRLRESVAELDLGRLRREVLEATSLKVRRQAACAVAKATQILSLIRKFFELFGCLTLTLLNKTRARPYLGYGSATQRPFNLAD